MDVAIEVIYGILTYTNGITAAVILGCLILQVLIFVAFLYGLRKWKEPYVREILYGKKVDFRSNILTLTSRSADMFVTRLPTM